MQYADIALSSTTGLCEVLRCLQELSFLLGSALPVPPTLRRKWLRMESLTQRLQQQVELLQETRPRLIMGGILDGLPTDSRFHDLLYHTDAVNT